MRLAVSRSVVLCLCSAAIVQAMPHALAPQGGRAPCFSTNTVAPALTPGVWQNASAEAMLQMNHGDCDVVDLSRWKHGGDQHLEYWPEHCDLATFNAEHMAQAMQGHSLMIVGDSLSSHTFMALKCSLMAAGQIADCEDKNHPKEGQWVDCLLRGGGRVMYRRNNQLISQSALQWILNEAHMGASDIVVLGFGAWYDHQGKLTNLKHDIYSLLDNSPASWPLLVWREELPQHFEGGGEWLGDVPERCGRLDENAVYKHGDMLSQLNDAFLQAKGGAHRIVLRVWGPLVDRFDEHAPLHFWRDDADYSKSDCTHYLLRSSAHRFIQTSLYNLVLSQWTS